MLARSILSSERQPIETWEPSRNTTAGLWRLNPQEQGKTGGRFIIIYLAGHSIVGYAIY